MHREIASDSDQLERFRREARAVAQLNHPHVVGVIDAGEDENTPYIVFEFVEGETLKDRIRRAGRLPIGEAVAYAIEIARALGAAHDRRIVHRDVKPQNVLIDEEGAAKVTDFGIARTLDRGGPDGRRPRAGHHRLRLARAGPRPAVAAVERPLLAGRRAVRDAHRRRALPRREPGRGGDEARARRAARRAAAPRPRCPARSPRSSTARRPRTSSAATPTAASSSPTSRTCWRSRRRAPGRRRARRPRSSARCPPAPGGGCRCGCATRVRWSPGSLLLAAIAGGVVLYALADRTERGAQGTRNVQAPPKTVALSLAQANAPRLRPVGRRRRASRPGEVRRRRRQQQHLVDGGLPGRRRSTASPAWGST